MERSLRARRGGADESLSAHPGGARPRGQRRPRRSALAGLPFPRAGDQDAAPLVNKRANDCGALSVMRAELPSHR